MGSVALIVYQERPQVQCLPLREMGVGLGVHSVGLLPACSTHTSGGCSVWQGQPLCQQLGMQRGHTMACAPGAHSLQKGTGKEGLAITMKV